MTSKETQAILDHTLPPEQHKRVKVMLGANVGYGVTRPLRTPFDLALKMGYVEISDAQAHDRFCVVRDAALKSTQPTGSSIYEEVKVRCQDAGYEDEEQIKLADEYRRVLRAFTSEIGTQRLKIIHYATTLLTGDINEETMDAMKYSLTALGHETAKAFEQLAMAFRKVDEVKKELEQN